MATRSLLNHIKSYVSAKAYDELVSYINSTANIKNEIVVYILSSDGLSNNLISYVSSKIMDELNTYTTTKDYNDLSIYTTTTEIKKTRLILSDKLKLRDTSVYISPRSITNLPIAIGDFTNSFLPCTPLDRNGFIHHISDYPISYIGDVYVDNELTTSGFTKHTAYEDETGKSISCILFNTAQHKASVKVSCKGVLDKETGDLIENPADVIKFIYYYIQEYDKDVIDNNSHIEFKNYCLNNNLKIAYYLNDVITIRKILDNIAYNINAFWKISDGQSIMKLRWLGYE